MHYSEYQTRMDRQKKDYQEKEERAVYDYIDKSLSNQRHWHGKKTHRATNIMPGTELWGEKF